MEKKESLLRLILNDLGRSVLVILLALMLISSAFYKIYITHNTRLLVTQKEKLSQQQDNLSIEWQSLQLEEQTFAEDSRIRRIAKKKLLMVQPTRNSTVLVELQ